MLTKFRNIEVDDSKRFEKKCFKKKEHHLRHHLQISKNLTYSECWQKFSNIQVADSKIFHKKVLQLYWTSFVAPPSNILKLDIFSMLTRFQNIQVADSEIFAKKVLHLWHNLAHWKLMPRAYLLLLLLWTLNNCIRGGLDYFRSKIFKVNMTIL